MPFITIKVLKGQLSNEEKTEMIKQVSETVAGIEASLNPQDGLVPSSPHCWCRPNGDSWSRTQVLD